MRLAPTEEAPGWLGRRDDRARLVAMLVLAGSLSAVASLPVATAGLAGALALALTSGLTPRALVRRLWPLLALLLPLILLTPFHHPPGAIPLVADWPWGPTNAGVVATGTVAARILAIALVSVTALDAAPFDRTIKALQDLRVPRPLVHTALLTYRYLFVLAEDLRRIRAALAARGFVARPNPSTLQTFGAVTGGLLVRSVAQTERVERAMRCRGYTGELILPSTGGLGLADVLLVVASTGLGATALVLDHLARGGALP